MEFTTHFELHSQTTRLVEGRSHGVRFIQNGVLTLHDVSFQKTLDNLQPNIPLQITIRTNIGQISNLSCCRFTRRY